VPHIGNYLGALQRWVQLQNEADATSPATTATPATRLVYCLVDLHAITVAQDAHALRRHKRESLAALLAMGLDPERCIIYYQSAVRFFYPFLFSWFNWVRASTKNLSESHFFFFIFKKTLLVLLADAFLSLYLCLSLFISPSSSLSLPLSPSLSLSSLSRS
jgi:hypothetical protein